MTGYGQAEAQVNGQHLHIEMRSINHRGLDLKLHLPPSHFALETTLRHWCRERLGRGRVEIRIHHEGVDAKHPKLNLTIAKSVHKQLESLCYQLAVSGEVTLDMILQVPGVWGSSNQTEQRPPEVLWAELTPLLEAAIEKLEESRAREGAALQEVLEGHLASFSKHLQIAAELAPTRVEEHRKRLKQRIDQLFPDGGPVDDQRLSMEIALFAERVDVNEEIERAQTHATALLALFQAPNGAETRVGKRIDFFLQELNRESNTLASKSRNPQLTRCAIDMKSSVESMREQVANIQ